MLPIWIIDLGGSATSKERLQNLLDTTGESLKPYWHYYHTGNEPVTGVGACKEFMDALVSDGRECYNAFNKAGYKVGIFQIVILGAADEELTQSIFAPLPGLIRDHLPRIISNHANLGVEITGILYIPSTINQLDSARDRCRAAMLLEDLNMLTERLGSRHFNRIVAYQDVQYKGSRFYSSLDEGQRIELLYEILTHLFYISAGNERLFDKICQNSGIFSLGAASVYYNSEQHHGHELKRLMDKLIAEFKETENTDEEYAGKIVREVLEEDVLNPNAVSARLREDCASLDIDLKKMDEEADPHPVWDLFCSDLFPQYYRKFLKFMPARLQKFLQTLSYVLLTRFSGVIRKNRETAVEHFKSILWSFYKKVFLDAATKFATIAQMESVYTSAKDFLLARSSELEFLLLEIVPVPKYLRHDYDKCLADEEENKPSKIMEKLKQNLKKEPVVLSLIVRCFLLGILLVFTIIPVLRFVSPNLINLGELATIEWLWAPVLFFLPLIIEFSIKLRRHFKRIKRLKYRLLAVTLLNVNKRLSSFLMDEQMAFYDALLKECEAQLTLLSEFREKISIPEPEEGKSILPETMFNQPLIGGQFCGEKLLEDESVSEAEIRVRDEKLKLSELEDESLLALLKDSFRQPETLTAADLSDKRVPEEHAESFVSILGKLFGPQLDIHTAENIGLMLTLLDKDVNISPLVKMAGVNGMLFSVASGNKPVLRITNAPRIFEDVTSLPDKATADYALLTCWQKISNGIQAQLVCNCQLDPLPPLSFADNLSLYYGFFRQQDLAYELAGIPLRIPKEDMEKLDKQIIGG